MAISFIMRPRLPGPPVCGTADITRPLAPLRRFAVRFGLEPRIAGVSRHVRAVSRPGASPVPPSKGRERRPKTGVRRRRRQAAQKTVPQPGLGKGPLSIPRILEASSKRGCYV